MTLFDEMLEKKAKRVLGKAFMDQQNSPPTYPNESKGFDIRNTVFSEFSLKMRKVKEEYQNALKQLGIREDRSNYTEEFGNQIAKVYPDLLEAAKVMVWENMESIISHAMKNEVEF